MTEFIKFLEEQGVEYYDWNISSGDGGSHLVPVDIMVENCTKDIAGYDTSIILLHDSAVKTTTVEALPQIIETILAMEDTVILPITEYTNAVHHVVVTKEEDKKEVKAQEAEAQETKEQKTEEQETKAQETKAQENKEIEDKEEQGD